MIIARLQIAEHNGDRYLAGRTTSTWPVPIGTPLVLRKRGDEYELIEVGERISRTPDDQNTQSFVLGDLLAIAPDDEEAGLTHKNPGAR